MNTITHAVVSRSVHIDVTGAPDVVGLDDRARVQTIHPTQVELFDGRLRSEAHGARRRLALVTGTYDREGATSAVYRTVRVQLGPEAPDWLLGLAAMHLPEEGWEYRT